MCYSEVMGHPAILRVMTFTVFAFLLRTLNVQGIVKHRENCQEEYLDLQERK
jgi:hypothetical protein